MSSNNKFKKHIQLPKTLLNELGDSSGHQDDQHYKVNSFGQTNNNNMKRKFQGKNITRKERRKQERQDKKRKINPNNKNNSNTQQKNKTVNNKNLSKQNKKNDSGDVETKEELNIPTDDSLDSDDFDEFDENDLTPEEWKELRSLEGHKESGSSSSSSSSSESESESSESDSDFETETNDIKPKKLLLKPTLKQKLAKKVISRNSKKHVSFNKKIMEKLIPARPNYGELPASSEDDEDEYYEEDYDIDDEDEDDNEDDNSYLDQLALSNSDEEDSENEEEKDESYLDQLALSESEEEEEVEGEKEMTVEETMAALKAAKEQKQQKQSKSSEEDDFDEDDSEGDYSEEEEKEEMTVEETMAALKAAKEKKQQKQVESSEEEDYSEKEEEEEKEMTVEETMAALKAVKEAKNKNKETPKTSKSSKTTKKEDPEEDFVPYEDPESDEDERNIKYYAKKLNMGKKSKKLRALDEYDAIGGLLEGLDFFDNYGENLGEYGDLAIKDGANDISSSESDSDSEDESDSEEDDDDVVVVDEEGDDEVYDEFDENDLTPEEWAQLRELEDSEMDYSEQSDEEEEKPKKKKKKSSKKKENLYGLDTQLDDEDQLAIASLENDMSNVDPQLTKDVKTLFNKLSESNINNIISSLLELFDSKPRQACINAIIDRIIIDCNIKEKLLDQFLMNYIGCVYAIWRFKGIDFGALFIQKLVEKIIQTLESEEDTSSYDDDENNSSKKGANLMSLLSFAFNFGVITNKLIYNLLDLLADVSNEFSVELILKCVSISGVLLRGENPKDLNMIINKLLSNLEDKKKDNQEEEDEDDDDSRLQFLVDTLRDLKLNKINKNLITKTNHSQMKKSISKSLKIDSKTLGSNSSQSIQVSLDDILNIDTKGKWWLIGGSYRENVINNNQNEDENNEDFFDNDIEFSDIELQDDFIDELPDYNKLAIQNKMSSSLSKAIFVGITSSQDPLDCIMRLDKLNLKKKDYQELLRILIHVSKLDTKYNPFYELVIIRLSKNMNGLNKFIKFQFWDIIKNFESANEDDDNESILTDLYGDFGTVRDGKITQEARLFGNLIFDRIIPFDIFKHIPILDGLNTEGELFISSLLYQLLLRIGKESEKKISKDKNPKSKSISYDSNLMDEIIFKTIQEDNQLIILKQLQWYTENKFDSSRFAFTSDKTKENRRTKWAIRTFKQSIDQNLKYLE